MARVIPFSTKFPAYHPKAGERTYFVEKILNSMQINHRTISYLKLLYELNHDKLCDTNSGMSKAVIVTFWNDLNGKVKENKLHTIRAGQRWKTGDIFSARVWSGIPYHSPQIIFAPDTVIYTTTAIDLFHWSGSDFSAGKPDKLNPFTWSLISVGELAKNDGLAYDDFKHWFNVAKGPFNGQIISWSDKCKY